MTESEKLIVAVGLVQVWDRLPQKLQARLVVVACNCISNMICEKEDEEEERLRVCRARKKNEGGAHD